jgi:ribonuclease Z
LFSIPVQHCFSSYGIVLELSKINIQLNSYNNNTYNNNNNNFKIVYSGDCRPSNSLIFPGMNCDILIHESTFDDTMLDDAIKKKHSTITEATEVG